MYYAQMDIKKIVTQLGGPTLVAKQFATTRENVSNWYQKGVPWKYRYRFSVMARAAGVKVPSGWEHF